MFRYEQAGKKITQIGSLPLLNPKEAVAYSLLHDIPFLPELPHLGDRMLSYIKEPGRLSALKEFKKHRFSTVKIQAVGPATLVLSGYDADEAVLRVYRHVEVIMDGLRAEEVILFLDEPALGQAGFDYEELWRPIFHDFPVIPGVHVCGNMQWDLLFRSELLAIISCDASRYDVTKYYPRFGKKIAWGVTSSQHVKDFQRGDLITPPCGLFGYKPEDLPKVLAMLREAACSVSSA